MGLENIQDNFSLDVEGLKRSITDNKELIEDRSGGLTEYASRIKSTVNELDNVSSKYQDVLDAIDNLNTQLMHVDGDADDAWNSAEAYTVDD